jgi:hypothetical protein
MPLCSLCVNSVDALLREETVSAEELNRILGPRPQLTPGQDGCGKVVRQE